MLPAQAQAAMQVDSMFGSPSGDPALGGTFRQPAGTAVRQSTGQVYVFDTENFRVQRFSASGVFERAWGWDVIQEGAPGDTASDQFEICTVIADCKTGVSGTGGGQIGDPSASPGLAIDQATGDVYISDPRNRRVQKFDADGAFLRAWGQNVVLAGTGNADELQRLTVDATAGSYTVTFDGQTTAPISATAAASAVQSALEALSNLAPGDVAVTGGPGGAGGAAPYLIQFGGTLVDVDQPQMTADGGGLSGGAGSAAVVTLVDGAVGFEICVPSNGDTCQGNFNGSRAGEIWSNANNVAVGPSGDVYVGEGSNGRVESFTSDGVPLRAWGWDVVDSGPGNQGTGDEQQQVTVNATGGTFTLTHDGQTTGPIAENAQPLAIKQALEALSNMGSGTTDVTGSSGGPWVVTFVNGRGRTQLPQMTVDSSALTGGAATGSVTTLADGAEYEVCVIANGDLCQAAKQGAPEAGKLAPPTVSGGDYYVAVDSLGRVYVSDAARVQRFQSDGTSPEEFAASELSSSVPATGPRQIAIDTGEDHVYVVKAATPGSELHVKEVLATDGSLAADGVHGGGAGIQIVNGIALADPGNEPNGKMYLSSTQGSDWVIVFDHDGGVQAGVGTIQPASDIGLDCATLNGLVDPNGFETSYRFEYSVDGIDWTPVGSFESVGSADGDIPVFVEVCGLQANASYHARLVTSTEFAGTAPSAEITFQTLAPPGPDVTTGAAQAVTYHSAQVRGRINPNNSLTTYHVEYGTTTGYGDTAPAVVEEGNAGAGGLEKVFIIQLSDLDPEQTYHYRFVATNEQGTTEGADREFTTRVDPNGSLPGGRAYEMVTPPDKSGRTGGQDTRVDSPLVGIPSADGESLLAITKWMLMDAGAGGSIPHSFNPLLVQRDPAGWDGHALNNVAPDQPSIAGLTNPAGVSSDLGVQAWHHNEWFYESGSSLGTRIFGDSGGTPDVAGSGWYDWLLDPSKAIGSVQSDSALLTTGGDEMVRWGGILTTYRGLMGPTAAEDPSHTQLPGDAGGDAVYRQAPVATGARDLVNGCTGTGAAATRIPSIDDNGTPGNPGDDEIAEQECAAGAVTSLRGAALGGGFTTTSSGTPVMGPVRRALSADGSRVIFASPDPHATDVPASCGGTTGAATDCPPQLYVRQYDSSGVPTVRWISRSAVAGQAAALLGRGVGYEGASADGRVIYFKTNAPLTPDDPNGGAPVPGGVTSGAASDDSWDLYRYELPGDNDVDPVGGTLTRVSGGPDGDDGDSTAGDFDPNVLATAQAQTSSAGVLRFLSDDGQKAYFATRGIIGDPGDPWNQGPAGGVSDPGGSDLTSTRNLYLYDAGKPLAERWRFVAKIPFSTFGIDSCASRHSLSGMAQNSSDDADPIHPSIPKIGRTTASCVHGLSSGDAIAFETAGQLTGDDEDAAGDVYIYDAIEDSLTRVSAPPSDDAGYLCDADANTSCNGTLGRTFLMPLAETVGLNGLQNQNLAVADDGRVSLFFESRIPFTNDDVNGSHMDVYQWRDGEVTLISPGTSDDGAHFSGNTADGEDVFFSTSEAIDPREIDADFDVYDARVGGGIPLPPEPEAPCEALTDSCQSQGGGTPTTGDRQTDRPGGGGNANPGARIRLAIKRPGRRAQLRAARRGVLAVKVSSSAAGTLKLTARARVRGKGRRVASARRRVVGGSAKIVRLRLNRPARAQLRRKGALRVSLRLAMRDARSRTLSLRLERRRK